MSTELIMNPSTWGVIRDQANVLQKSGFLPATVKSPEAAVAIIMKGVEIGFQPMQAFSSIDIILGKPCLKPEAMLALIYKLVPGAFIDFVRIEDELCEISAARPGRTSRTFIFKKEDAVRAGLIDKDNWKKWPRAMYKARCIAEMSRTLFPDALMGCSYTAEELQPDLTVNEEGEIIDVKPAKEKEGNKLEVEKDKEGKIVANFRIDNNEQLDKLLKKLDDEKIPSDLHDDIAQALNGLPFTVKNVEETISKIRG